MYYVPTRTLFSAVNFNARASIKRTQGENNEYYVIYFEVVLPGTNWYSQYSNTVPSKFTTEVQRK
jgi:hypothetical protein